MPSDYKLTDPAWKRYYNNRTLGKKDMVAIRELGTSKLVGSNHIKVKFIKDPKNAQTFEKAIQKSREVGVESKGISILDFDDTLAVSQSLVKFTRPDGTTGTLTPAQYASTYENLLGQGYVFDFSEFNKVIKGRTAPLFQKALKLANKFGTKDMFVLTARPPESAVAIFEFLKANGLNIPLKNITGLANSTAEAKALWVAEKVADGYNDFYFADDALQNVQAVKNILDQFDVKSKVRQAKGAESKAAINKAFNEILENVTGISADKRFGAAKARKRGASKGKFRFFIPPSHEDFVGLLYNFSKRLQSFK
jgi:predicted DNA-binding protein